MQQHVARRGHAAIWLVAVVTLALVLTAVPRLSAEERSVSEIDRDLDAVEAQIDEARGELGITQEQIDEVRAELDATSARLDRARADLRIAQGELSLAHEALGDAQVRREIANTNRDRAAELLQMAEADLESEESQLTNQIAAAYKYGAAGRGAMFLHVVRAAQTPNDLAVNLYRLQAVIDYQDTAVDRVDHLRVERSDLLGRAEETRRLAARQQAEAADTLAFVEDLTSQAERLADTIATDEARLARILQDLEREAGGQAGELAALEGRRDELKRERRAAVRRTLNVRDGVLCPVTPSWFQNDWGFPRSGGRTHKGTDMFADRGTPIRAIADGIVRRVDRTDNYRPGSNRGDLGGRSVSYWVDGNEYWYFAHMEEVAPGLAADARVEQGEVIGWVGNSGNAYNTPTHTHVGRYVDGRAVNPYGTLSTACS